MWSKKHSLDIGRLGDRGQQPRGCRNATDEDLLEAVREKEAFEGECEEE